MEDPTEKRSNDLLYFSGFGMVDPRGPSPEVLHMYQGGPMVFVRVNRDHL